MQVLYFPENNTYANQTGVSIRPNDFGGLNVRDPTAPSDRLREAHRRTGRELPRSL